MQKETFHAAPIRTRRDPLAGPRQDPEIAFRPFRLEGGIRGRISGYTFIDTGVEGGTFVAISPRQGPDDEVLFFVAVQDVAATLEKAEKLGGSIVQPVQHCREQASACSPMPRVTG